MKDHTIRELVNRLRESNIIHAKTYNGAVQVLHSWMRTGKLKLRQAPHSGYHYVNDNEIEAILKEFSMTGKGYWAYDE